MQLVFNWHITENCNYNCKYCFGKWKAKDEIWKKHSTVHKLFSEIGSIQQGSKINHIDNGHIFNKIRINFVGGEPLLLGDKLKQIITIASSKYKFATSIVTNASLLAKHINVTQHIETLGISIDSFSKSTNINIGRCSSSKNSLSEKELLQLIQNVRGINPRINIKTNTVVSPFNWKEKPIEVIRTLAPDKIKIFRQLPFGKAKGISDHMFNSFLSRNKSLTKTFVEDNSEMIESYLMIDPMGRLFQNSNKTSSYSYSAPIHAVGIQNALSTVNFNIHKYINRYKG